MAPLALLALTVTLAAQGEALVVEPAITTWLEVDTNANRVPEGVIGGDDDPAPREPYYYRVLSRVLSEPFGKRPACLGPVGVWGEPVHALSRKIQV